MTNIDVKIKASVLQAKSLFNKASGTSTDPLVQWGFIIIFGIICLVAVYCLIRAIICWRNDSKQLDTVKNENSKLIDEIKGLKETNEVATKDITTLKSQLEGRKEKVEDLTQIIQGKDEKIIELDNENAALLEKIENYKRFIENPPGYFPKLASAVADCVRVQCENLEYYFATKPNPSRKSADIVNELKWEFSEAVKARKMAEYNLEYLMSLYPALEDVMGASFQEIKENAPDYKAEVDPVREYLTKEEWQQLSESERNQRALDNYIKRNKSKWQIGRDYELYIGYIYHQKGYSVDYTGSYAKFEDLGRDLICKKDNLTLIIQCKYWSKSKEIHENHINQLYGTTLAYSIVNKIPVDYVKCLLITNTTLSPMAKQFSELLDVKYKEKCEMGEFPRIKCNINHDEMGKKTKIYHLPMDQQYDRTQIKNKDEFFAFTVKEAEDAGFRRAFKYRG